MKLINALQNTAAFSLVAFSLAAPSNAQSDGVSEFWGEYFGGSVAGAAVGANAFAHYSNANLGSLGNHFMGGAGASLEAGVALFDHYLEAFYFGAHANVNAMTWAPGSSSATIQAEGRLMGFTFYDSGAGGTALSTSIPLPPYVIVNKEKTFQVGPVPITVAGSLSLGSELGLSGDANLYNRSFRVSPSVRGWVQGAAGVGLGTDLVGAGVEATMRVADTTLTYDLLADIDDNFVTGFFTTTIIPLAIEIEVYFQVFIRFSLTVYEWAMPFSFQFKILD